MRVESGAYPLLAQILTRVARKFLGELYAKTNRVSKGRTRGWEREEARTSYARETSSAWSFFSLAELLLGRTAHTREKRMGQNSLRHARYRAEANPPIIEKDSPVEEKVWSSTPVRRVPSAKQGARDRSM